MRKNSDETRAIRSSSARSVKRLLQPLRPNSPGSEEDLVEVENPKRDRTTNKPMPMVAQVKCKTTSSYTMTSSAHSSYVLRLANVSPPDCGIVRTVEHLRQFLLDLHQPAFTHIRSGSLHRTVLALLRIDNVPVPEVGDFVTKAGEVFREVRHNPSIRLKQASVWVSSPCCKRRA